MKNLLIKIGLLIAVILLLIAPNFYIIRNTMKAEDGISSIIKDNPELELADDGLVIFDNKEYLKLNVAELYIMLSRKPEVAKSINFMIRGLSFKNEELANSSEIALLRLMVNCCFADAVPYFVKVVPTDDYEYNEYEWINVFGKIEITDENDPVGNFRLIAEKIAPISENLIDKHQIYIFEVRQEAPFAY